MIRLHSNTSHLAWNAHRYVVSAGGGNITTGELHSRRQVPHVLLCRNYLLITKAWLSVV